MKNILTILVVLFMSFSMNAQKKNKNVKHDIKVNGTCEMCKKRIEKAAFSVKGVKSAEWHQDDKTLHIILNEQKSSVLDVQKAVAKVGHDTNDVKATDEEYNALHGCCQYERK